MDDYKIALIHGDNFEDRGLIDGKLEYCGEISKDSLHVVNLLNYAKQNFPDISIFQQLSVRHQPEIISYFLTKLGYVVFLNMTRYDSEHLKKYGKFGMFLLPDKLTDNQKEALNDFCSSISNFDISINYDLSIDTGILDSKTIQGFNHEKPIDLLNVYLNRINTNDINCQK